MGERINVIVFLVIFHLLVTWRAVNACCRCNACKRCGLNIFSTFENSINIPMKCIGNIANIVTAVPIATGCRQPSSYSFGEITLVGGNVVDVDAVVAAETNKT